MSYTQRETPILSELCTLLVEDVYGELAARVFSILARHGRQTLASLARTSYLNSRQIKYGLVILVQQHLIFHSAVDTPVTYYEINWEQSYALVRYGKITKLVEDRSGKKAANVMSNLLTLGHTRIGDLKEAYFPPETESGDESDDDIVNGVGVKRRPINGAQANGTTTKVNGVVNGVPSELEDTKPDPDHLINGDGKVNGISKQPKVNGSSNHEAAAENVENSKDAEQEDTITSVDELYDVIQSLMHRGWVMKVEDTQFLSPGDLHDVMRQDAIEGDNHGTIPTGTKDKDIVEKGTLRRKRELRDSWLTVPKFASRKRQAPDSEYDGPNKRVKMNGGSEWSQSRYNHASSGGHYSSPEDNLVIRVNPEKVAVAMRTEQLVSLVEQRIGYVTARIYRTMLRILEANIKRCYDEWDDAPPPNPEAGIDAGIDPHFLVTARDVAKKISRDLDVCEGLDPNAVVQVTKRGHVRSSNTLSQPVDPQRMTLDEKTRIIDKHIQLLSNDPFHFVTWHSRAGWSQWRIEFEEIAKVIIQHEIENTISSRKGSLGVKLIRALKKKGKLDERQACNTMMMSANDIRGIINDLTVQGFVQTQEIPKVERREAKHSIHLIWYDRQRAREKLLHDTYKGMVRIMQRIAFEREKVQPLLSKAERSDVVGNEEKWLSKPELDALKKWKDVQEKLVLQLFREDELVATLRDFHGPLISV